MGNNKTIYHITTPEQWEHAQEESVYTHPSISHEGYIHCSYRHQVIPSAKKHFAGQKGLIVLCIDPQRLLAEVFFERGVDSTQDFPHIYGKINLDAVQQVIDLTPDHPEEFLRQTRPFNA